MEHPNDFIKLLRQIMSQECKPLIGDEKGKLLYETLNVARHEKGNKTN